MAAIQASFIHVHLRPLYQVDIPDSRAMPESALRDLPAMLRRLRELGPEPFGEGRPHERRVAVTCRSFSVLFAALLRMAGVPVRCRCGFGSYFGDPTFWCDHWIVERWDGERWAMSDAQLDARQLEAFKFDADPLDLPAGAFRSGGEGWLACREHGEDPERFGIFEAKGWDFIKGNVLRDLAALAGIELLPWDFWGLMDRPYAAHSPEELALLDRAARATPMLAPDMAVVDELACAEGLRVPHTITTLDVGSCVPGRVVEVTLEVNT